MKISFSSLLFMLGILFQSCSEPDSKYLNSLNDIDNVTVDTITSITYTTDSIYPSSEAYTPSIKEVRHPIDDFKSFLEQFRSDTTFLASRLDTSLYFTHRWIDLRNDKSHEESKKIPKEELSLRVVEFTRCLNEGTYYDKLVDSDSSYIRYKVDWMNKEYTFSFKSDFKTGKWICSAYTIFDNLDQAEVNRLAEEHQSIMAARRIESYKSIKFSDDQSVYSYLQGKTFYASDGSARVSIGNTIRINGQETHFNLSIRAISSNVGIVKGESLINPNGTITIYIYPQTGCISNTGDEYCLK